LLLGLASGCGAAASPTSPAQTSSLAVAGSETSPIASRDEPEPVVDEEEEPGEDEVPPPASVGDSLSVLGDNRPRGELPRARIEAGLASSRADLGQCISQASARGGESEGRVVVTFVIEPDGRVGAAAYLVSTLVDDELAECILGVFRELHFDRPRGGIVMASHAFQFRGGTRRPSPPGKAGSGPLPTRGEALLPLSALGADSPHRSCLGAIVLAARALAAGVRELRFRACWRGRGSGTLRRRHALSRRASDCRRTWPGPGTRKS
jgi:hypothetical protein